MLPEITVYESKVAMWPIIPRIDLCPEIIGLAGFFQITGDKFVVIRIDVKSLSFAHSIVESIGRFEHLCGLFALSKIRIGGPKESVGHRKLRIESDSSLEEWNGCTITL